jgi:hypothetical protein
VSIDFPWADFDPDGFQLSATELQSFVRSQREWAELMQPRSPERYWEDDFDDGLTEEEYSAAYAVRVA